MIKCSSIRYKLNVAVQNNVSQYGNWLRLLMMAGLVVDEGYVYFRLVYCGCLMIVLFEVMGINYN